MSAAGIRRAILLTHRWLGIAGGLLFVLWLASGIAMTRASGTAMPSWGATVATVAIVTLPLPARRAALAVMMAAPGISLVPAMTSSLP